MNRNRTHPLRSSPLRLQRNRVDKLVQPPPVDLDFIKSNEYLNIDPTAIAVFLSSYTPSVSLTESTTYTNNKAGPGFISSSGFLKMRTARPAEPRFEYLASPIGTPIRPLGINIDIENINYLENSRTMATDVGTYQWTVTSMTGAGTLNAIGPDGTTSAITLKATANLGFIQQVRGSTAGGTKYFSVWLKRKTGIGAIEIKIAGTSWSARTITTEWQRYSVTSGIASSSVGIRFQNINDEVYVYAPQLHRVVPSFSTTLPNEIIGDSANITSGSVGDYFEVNINPATPNNSVITGEVGTFFLEIDMSDRGGVAQYTEASIDLSDGGDQTWQIYILRDPSAPGDDQVSLRLTDAASGEWYFETFVYGVLNDILRVAISWDTRTPTGTVSAAVWNEGVGTFGLSQSSTNITSLNAYDPGLALNNARLFYIRKCKVWNEYKLPEELQMIVTNG